MVPNVYILEIRMRERHTADRRTAQQLRDVRQVRHRRVGATHDLSHAHGLGGLATWLRDLGRWLCPGAPSRRRQP